MNFNYKGLNYSVVTKTKETSHKGKTTRYTEIDTGKVYCQAGKNNVKGKNISVPKTLKVVGSDAFAKTKYKVSGIIVNYYDYESADASNHSKVFKSNGKTSYSITIKAPAKSGISITDIQPYVDARGIRFYGDSARAKGATSTD